MGKIKTTLLEKIGYGFGDMSSSMFWKIFSYYLPFFYSNIFGLRLDQVALLLIVTRIWDAVSDPMMGIIADRTHSKWGKYRPYLLLMSMPFAVCGILLFTTPAASQTTKLMWAYITYIMMMTVYTGINVPYGAMLGVMTDDSDTKTVFSSFRMFFAYGGSFIALFCWEPLCHVLGGYQSTAGWQNSMFIIATCCFVLFILSFLLTKEKLHTKSTVSVGNDLKALLKNAPWWILIGSALCTNLFNTVRGSTVAYFFNDVIGPGVNLNLGGWSFLFYAGLFLSIGEVCNMIGVALAVPITFALGKKTTYMSSFAALLVLSIIFFYIPVTGNGYWLMLLLQIVISILTGIISPLVWSMYADVSDYAENRDGTASTGLIFSSASMAQKFGSAFGGAVPMWILAAFGYNTAAGAVQTPEALYGIRLLMSWVPAAVAAIAMIVTFFYPLTKKRVAAIQEELAVKRASIIGGEAGEVEAAEESAEKKSLFGLPKAMKIAVVVLVAIMLAEIIFVCTRGTDKGTAAFEETVEAPEALNVRGTTLYAGEEPVVLHGISLGWHNIWPRFYNAGAVSTLANDWGAQVIRAAIGTDSHAKIDNPDCHDGYKNDKNFALECLYEVIDAAIANGIYVIADWHSHMAYMEEAKEFFAAVASKYPRAANVIYELYNEPTEDSWEDLKAYAEAVIPVIDSLSEVHPLILMGCPHWDQDIHLVPENPVEGYDNIMYTVHFYAATHGHWLRDRADMAMEAGIPVFISECAATEATGDGEISIESWTEWTSWAEEKGVSMVCWSVSDKDEACSMLTPEDSDGGPWELTKPWGLMAKEWVGNM